MLDGVVMNVIDVTGKIAFATNNVIFLQSKVGFSAFQTSYELEEEKK